MSDRCSHSKEVKQQTHLVAQFDSGHTAWIKIALEKDPATNKARAHLGIWCQNASGATVRCGAIQSKANSASSLTGEHWEETGSTWRYVIKFPFCVGSNQPCT